jgi:hypothetical protein
MVAEKDFNAPSHPDLPQVRNLEVIKAMQSLTSKGYVKTQFSWQWYYYTLTPEGLDYLREVSRRMRRLVLGWDRLVADYRLFCFAFVFIFTFIFISIFVHPVLFLLILYARPTVPPPPQRDRPPDPQEARPSSTPCQARRCRPRRRLQGSSRW